MISIKEQAPRRGVNRAGAHGLSMAIRFEHAFCLVLALTVTAPVNAIAQGYPGFPGSIMAPEPGTGHHHTATVAPSSAETTPRSSLLGHEQFVAKLHRRPGVFVATRGSSGSVLPASLPKTKLIPPEGTHTLTLPPAEQEQGLTMVPGLARGVPNLSHGPETFQDRASRCSFQSGLYGVPGGARTQYMGACLQ